MGGETREKIRTAPGESRQKAQQNSHDGLGGLARLGGLAFLRFQAEDRHDFLQIFPDFAFRAGITQQVGGMIRGHQLSSAKFEPLSTKLRDATIGFQQGLRCDGPEADDYFGRDGINLAQQKRRARSDFVFLGGTIFRRAAFHDVADVDVFPLQAHCFDHLGEKFSGAADKREALHVFVVSGAFADENEVSFGITVAENNFVARGVEFATRAFAEVGSNLEERIVGNLVKGFEERWARGDRQGVGLSNRLR